LARSNPLSQDTHEGQWSFPERRESPGSAS
jgi:hypothetical protein